MKKPGERDGYRERLKERLLQTAAAIAAGDGLGDMQARRVAKEADCSVGTVYNIFGDIDGLILAVNERTLADMGRILTAAAGRAAPVTLEARLMILADAYLDFATANQMRWRTVFEHRLPDARPFPEAYAADRRRLLALLDAQLESAVPDPAVRSDAAFALFSAVHGIVLLSLDAKLGPFDPVRCERQIRFVVGHVVAGLGAGAAAVKA
jgi:AcrR family transcriptional regulator